MTLNCQQFLCCKACKGVGRECGIEQVCGWERQVVVARVVAGIMARVSLQQPAPPPPFAALLPAIPSQAKSQVDGLSRQLADSTASGQRTQQEAAALRLQLKHCLDQQARERRMQQAVLAAGCTALAAAAAFLVVRTHRQ